MIPLATAERVAWPSGRSPRRCRVIARHHARQCFGLAIAPDMFIVAGQLPLCRPAAVYLVREVGEYAVLVTVAYSPGSTPMVGRAFAWVRTEIEAAFRLGEVRVVANWQAPTETLAESRDRRLDPRGAAPPTGQAAIAAGD